MGHSDESLLKAIRHYQQSLEKHIENGNDAKLLHYIDRLGKLPIRVYHLEQTGVGRTVNSLRKLGGEVGSSAKALVAMWKKMVVGEQEAEDNAEREAAEEEEEDEEEDDEDDDDDENEVDEGFDDEVDQEPVSTEPPDRPEQDFNTREEESYESKESSSHRKSDNKRTEEKHKSRHSSSKKDTERSEPSTSKPHKSDRHKHHKSDVSQNGHLSSSSKHRSHKRKNSDDSSDSEAEHVKHQKRVKRDQSSEDDDARIKQKSDKKSHKRRKSRQDVNSDSEDSNEARSEKHRSSSRVDSDSEEKKHSKSKDKKKHKSRNEEEDEVKESKKKHKSESKSKKGRDPSSEGEEVKTKKPKHHSKEEKAESSSYKKDKHKSDASKDKPKKEETKKHENKKSKEHEKREKSVDSKTKESGGKSKSSTSTKSEKTKTSPSKGVIINGIDSGSGASFAEALGMLCEPSSSKSSSKRKSNSSAPTSAPLSLEKSPKEKTSSGDDSTEMTSFTTPEKPETALPKLLKEPAVEPLDINISSLLPTITPNYRPLGSLIVAESPPKKFLNEYDALSEIITSKNQRTKVYSGNKAAFGSVPSLFEICIRVLQDNIDALEYTGGVPYLILKPVLDKATPNQLFILEHHNPYLIEETDDLWRLHCQKDFRNKKRDELESWREMYMRCLDEREAKLKALTENFKQAQKQSVPERKAKLAYVDSIVKPPRNIARKQAKNGTTLSDRRPVITPTARLNSLAIAGEAGKVAVPNPGARAAERSSSHAAVKPKKAPLMAKSLSLLKNRFRR